MVKNNTVTFCTFELVSTCAIFSSLMSVIGLIELILYSLNALSPIGLMCSYGGCNFAEKNIETIFRIYNIIQALSYLLFGAVFLAAIIKGNARLVSIFILFTLVNIVSSLIFVIVAQAKLTNFLALSNLYVSNLFKVSFEGSFLYLAMLYRKSINRTGPHRDYLQLTNLCLTP